jgi:formylglycine-generating enzyme required for sulfatase activity
MKTAEIGRCIGNARNAALMATVAVLLGCLAECGCGKKESSPGKSIPSIQSIRTASGIEMAPIPAGDFLMGNDRGEEDEKPAHRVRVSGFYMDKVEVTQKSYEALMGTNPSKFKGPDKPVERISWLSAVKYCNARSLKEGLQPCYDPETMACNFDADGYRLPTEAEWECACRAGSATEYSFGNDPALLREYGWFKENSGEATNPVGTKRPNAWGLYDMHGNVSEWCNDFYAEDAYRRSGGDNPRGPATGEKRVLRGGSWRSEASQCRSSARSAETPGFADVCFGYETYGFRCVRKAAPDAGWAR